MTRLPPVRTVLLVALAVSTAGVLPASTVTPASADTAAPAGDVLVVDDDGGADYADIQAAVDAADPGDIVRVRSGTYRETVVVDVNLTIVAPQGAILDGSGLDTDSEGIRISEDATVVVDGLTITGYHVGVDAAGTTTDWVVRNATIRDTGFDAVYATGATGDWRLRNVTIRNTSDGIDAVGSTGRWVVRDAVIRNTTEGSGVEALDSAGSWVLADVTVADVDFVGVAASHTDGDWRIVNSTVRNTTVGIGAFAADGDWTIRNSTIANASEDTPFRVAQPPLGEGVGLAAGETNGSWTVRGTRFVGNDPTDVDATGADPAGDARGNWWGGAGGPDDSDCTGNVDCGAPLSEWPPESMPTASTPAPTTKSTTGAPATTSPATTTTSSASTTASPESTTSGPTSPGTTTATDSGGQPGFGVVVALAGLVVAALLVGRRGR